MSDAHFSNAYQRQALGLVTHDNTGGPFVVECQGCGAVYPSFQCTGGSQIADTGDYNDTRCPHCETVEPEECENVGLAWNTQQLKINALQQRLTAADERADELDETDRSPKDYAIEHAEYMAKSADDVLAKFQAYGLTLLAVDEGGDDGEGELFEAIDYARGDLQESMVDLRSMVYEFRKRRTSINAKP